MISLSNGYQLRFACASGALSWHGRGWWWERPLLWLGLINPHQLTVVAKTVTIQPKVGNLKMWCPWRCVRLVDGGAVNAIGLTNNGIDHWIEKHYPVAKKHGYNIAVSIQPDDVQQAKVMGEKLIPLDLAYVEVNLSCPNVEDHGDLMSVRDVLDGLHATCKHPVVVKVSYEQAMSKDFVKLLDGHPVVEAVHAINTVPWDLMYPGRKSPIEKHTGKKGGVSGGQIFPFTLRAIHYLHENTKLPIIAGGGISCLSHLIQAEKAGAMAFSIGTLFLRRPWKPKRLINEFVKGRVS